MVDIKILCFTFVTRLQHGVRSVLVRRKRVE